MRGTHSRRSTWAVTSLSVVLTGLSALLLADVSAWYLLPRTTSAFLEDYRRPLSPLERSYPRDYFVNHPNRGFDIAAHRQGTHYVHELGVYPIWSNALGCFDAPVDEGSLDAGFIYLAGDSFTWGFTPWEQHFGSLLQQRLDRRTLKCGVPSTGQRHQFDKFIDVTRQIGVMPEVVVVNVVANDINDDYAYPANGVEEGLLVATRELAADDTVIDIPRDLIRTRAREVIESPPPVGWSAVRGWLLEHSLSFNILRRIWHRLKPAAAADGNETDARSTPPGNRPFWTLAGPYAHYPSDIARIAAPNLEALATWQAHADAQGYRLLVAIIPWVAVGPQWPTYFEDFRNRLNDRGICVIDASPVFDKLEQPASLYWAIDGHFNPDGHRVYADFLAAALRDDNDLSRSRDGCSRR